MYAILKFNFELVMSPTPCKHRGSDSLTQHASVPGDEAPSSGDIGGGELA
jgi:hypothetical protein